MADLEAEDAVASIRKRPGMFIGGVDDGSGLHHTVLELTANVVDLHLSGLCSWLGVTLHRDGRG